MTDRLGGGQAGPGAEDPDAIELEEMYGASVSLQWGRDLDAGGWIVRLVKEVRRLRAALRASEAALAEARADVDRLREKNRALAEDRDKVRASLTAEKEAAEAKAMEVSSGLAVVLSQQGAARADAVPSPEPKREEPR